MEKFSFIVIGYNVEKYIEKCINSIINQNVENIEVIFVDDGSTDRTQEIVKRLFDSDSRFKYIYQKNKGANVARITGYKNATGKYITFVDGDDWVSQGYVKNSILCFKQQDYDFLSYNFNFFFEDGKVIFNEKFEDKIYRGEDFLKAVLKSKTPHYLWNKVYKYDFLKKIGFENIPQITMGDDLAANVKMGLMKPLVLNCNKPYYYYFLKTNSVSQKFNEKYIEIITSLEYIEKCLYQYFDKDSEINDMMDYQYFCMFYYYVVKSKYKKSYVHKAIYEKWKNKRVSINNNLYIKEYIKRISKLEFILLKIYNYNFNLGYYISRIYLKLIRKK